MIDSQVLFSILIPEIEYKKQTLDENISTLVYSKPFIIQLVQEKLIKHGFHIHPDNLSFCNDNGKLRVSGEASIKTT